jgi:hypothetical protein
MTVAQSASMRWMKNLHSLNGNNIKVKIIKVMVCEPANVIRVVTSSMVSLWYPGAHSVAGRYNKYLEKREERMLHFRLVQTGEV